MAAFTAHRRRQLAGRDECRMHDLGQHELGDAVSIVDRV
jgi:hypothetical protein